jgi:branched-chain amino acid aminotransferase
MDSKTDKIWLDGKFVDWDKAQIHILTHTLHYGWGVFEGIRCYHCHDGSSAIFRLKEHVDRLFDSAHIVGIKVPFSKEEISSAILETFRVNKLKEGYIRPIVFVGDGEMGIYVKKVDVRVGIAVWSWGAYLGDEGLAKGIRAKVSSFTRLQVSSQMSKAKVCGNYVNSILAKREIIAAGYDEAILLDTEGYVSEASGENIFIVKNGTIKTTPLTSILPGITRDSVITIAMRLFSAAQPRRLPPFVKLMTAKSDRDTRDLSLRIFKPPFLMRLKVRLKPTSSGWPISKPRRRGKKISSSIHLLFSYFLNQSQMHLSV